MDKDKNDLPLIKRFVRETELPLIQTIGEMLPWEALINLTDLIAVLKGRFADDPDYQVSGEQLTHRSAIIENGAQLKGAMIVGPGCFVAAGALLRGGVILDAGCIVGHGAELKTSIMLTRSKLAHFNFVGDSILGADVNLEAGVVIANYRNEEKGAEIKVRYGSSMISTGVNKFGAIVGEGSAIGANAVLAPGTLLEPHSVVRRGESVDT